jgi:hypothetical protein
VLTETAGEAVAPADLEQHGQRRGAGACLERDLGARRGEVELLRDRGDVGEAEVVDRAGEVLLDRGVGHRTKHEDVDARRLLDRIDVSCADDRVELRDPGRGLPHRPRRHQLGATRLDSDLGPPPAGQGWIAKRRRQRLEGPLVDVEIGIQLRLGHDQPRSVALRDHARVRAVPARDGHDTISCIEATTLG